MMTRTIMLVSAAVALAACGRTKDGDVTVERPGDVDVNVTTTKDTIPMPSIGTKIDTINTPVVGTKKTEVRVPTVKKP